MQINKTKGFTLVEVMIALVIASTSIVALLKISTQTSNNIIYFQEKTLANIVTSNLAVTVRLNKSLKLGYTDKKYKMANIEWQYRNRTEKVSKDLVKTTILVFSNQANKDAKKPSAKLLVYLNKE